MTGRIWGDHRGLSLGRPALTAVVSLELDSELLHPNVVLEIFNVDVGQGPVVGYPAAAVKQPVAELGHK